jgi:hypothetical protein
MLRPGRAGANNADDHVETLDQALSGLPEEYQTGHFADDDPASSSTPAASTSHNSSSEKTSPMVANSESEAPRGG